MKPDNPPAFPISGNRKEHDYNSGEDIIAPFVQKGMTLRDYFAGQALALFRLGDFSKPDKFALCAYEIADAMLLARQDKGV